MAISMRKFIKCRGGGIGRPACRQAGAHASKTIMEYNVYAIRSLKRNYIYVGLTNNIKRRIKQHNTGIERTTRSYAPFKTIHTEKFDNRKDARKREQYLKSGVGKEFLKKL